MEKTLLNLIPGACSPEVHLSQYDKGRAVPFKLAEGKSAYSVPDGSEIVVQATKPSGLGFVVPVTFDGDTATMTITETMSNEYGRFPAELSITNNGNRIGTANFVMNIERSPHPEGTIDGDAESLLPELTLLVERIEAAADSVDEDTQIVTEAKAEVLQAKADTLQAKADTLSARDESVSAKDLAVSSAETSVEASQRAEQLVGSVETKADAIVKSSSGDIASFNDGGDGLLVKSLKVNIVPKQSGSGDPSPSNVRPISGTDTVNVFDRGGNYIDESTNESGAIDGNGNPIANSLFNRTTLTPIKNGVNAFLKIYGVGESHTIRIHGYGIDGNWIQQLAMVNAQNDTTASITVPNDVYFLRISYPLVALGRIVLYQGEAPTVETYEGESKSISLGQTVYGGVLDVVSGKLVIDTIYVDLGGQWWAHEYVNGRYRWYADTSAFAKKENGAILCCSQFAVNESPITGSGVDNTIYVYQSGGTYLNCFSKDSMTNEEFKQAMSGVIAIYKWNNATEIQLTPTEVKSLLGSNNIWSDSGTVEVEYRADTTLAYNELLSLIASL